MLPVQFGEVDQIARVAEYVHSSSQRMSVVGKGWRGFAVEGRGEKFPGPIAPRKIVRIFPSLGSLMEMCASNETEGNSR